MSQRITKLRKAAQKRIDTIRKKLAERIKAIKAERAKPATVYTRTSPNQSARTGSIALIVIHDTESHYQHDSNADLVAIANYFSSSSAQSSSHVITDDDGHSARCVSDDRKAWHCVAFNSASLGIEQIGFASQTSWPDAQVDETARWVAKWAKKYGIPIERGAVSGSSVTKKGVITHGQLGSAGGGHTDPGAHYPIDRLLTRARHFRSLL